MFHRFHDLKGGPGPQDPEMVNNRNRGSIQVDTMESRAVIYSSMLCSSDAIQRTQPGNTEQQHLNSTNSPGPDYINQGIPILVQGQNDMTTGGKIITANQGSHFVPESYRMSPSEAEQHFSSFNSSGEERIATHLLPNVTDDLRTSPNMDSGLARLRNQPYQLSVEDQRSNTELQREITESRSIPVEYKQLSHDNQQHANEISEHSLNADNYTIYANKNIENTKRQIQESQNQSLQYSKHQLVHSHDLPKYNLNNQHIKSGHLNNPDRVQRISQSVKPQNYEEQSSKHLSESQKVSRETENQMVEIQRLRVGNQIQTESECEGLRRGMDDQHSVESQGNIVNSERFSNDHPRNEEHSSQVKHHNRNLPAQSSRPVVTKQETDAVKYYGKEVYNVKLEDGDKQNSQHGIMSKSVYLPQVGEQAVHRTYSTYVQFTDGTPVRPLECYESIETIQNAGNHETVYDRESPIYSREILSRNGDENYGIIHNEGYPKSKLSKCRQPKQYICHICDLEFKNGTQLKNHAWHHTGEKPFSCETCHATFTQHSNLKTHMRIHTGERPYVCEECNATFTQISNLRTHQKIHTGEKPFECDECGTKFLQQSNLKSHKLIHTGERPFQCDQCNATFVQSTHLRNHKRIHSDERPYGCEECGARFRQLSNLKTHEKIHTGERPHVCPNCNSAFAQKSNLKSHILKLHATDGSSPSRRGRKKKLEPIKPHYCDLCGATFTLVSNLKIHTRLHTGEKPYSCNTCSASFAQKSNLKSHKLTHSDDKPYQCNECESAFRQKTNLRAHKKKKHYPEKNFSLKVSHETQYDMNKRLNHADRSGQHIEEPIIQIRERKGDSIQVGMSALENEPGNRKHKYPHFKTEQQQGYNSNQISEQKPYSNGKMQRESIETNPYDTSHF